MLFCARRFSPRLKSILFRRGNIKRCFHENFSPQQEIVIDILNDEKSKGITVLGLNRGAAKNSLSKSVVKSFYSALSEVEKDKGVRVLILRSLVPKVFCSGADLNERLEMNQSEVIKFVKMLRTLTFVIENLSVPVIAAIDGVALGGGLEISLACDFRISSTNAKLGLVETKLGIIPGAGGTQRLPRLVGPAIAKELIFTAKVINGEEAKKLGIVNHVVEQNGSGDAAYQKALQVAQEILPNGPISIEMAKYAINKGLEVNIYEGCSVEDECYTRVVPTKDRLEGLLAFKEKRPPVYKGE